MTDEQIMALPKKAANRAEVDACYYLGAFGREVERMQGDIEKRVRMIPGGVARPAHDRQQDGEPAARDAGHV